MRGNDTGFISQFNTLFLRNCELFLNDKKKMLSTFCFPLAIGIVIVLVAKDSFFEDYEGTKSALFTVLCAGIYVGMFNSLTSICKERKIIKREYMTNMRLISFVFALAVFQGILCLVQSGIFMGVYWSQIDFPSEGLYFANSFLDYSISMFFIMYVSDLIGMVISSAVRSNEMANLIAPIIIIVQLVFSGVLFTLDGKMKDIANYTVSKWGMEAFGSIAKLNDLSLKIQATVPQIVHDAEDAYEATSQHLIHVWGVMSLFILVLIIACIVLLRRVEKDAR